MEYTKENVKKQLEESLSKIRKMGQTTVSAASITAPPPKDPNIVYWMVAVVGVALLTSFIRR